MHELETFHCVHKKQTFGDLIYACKIRFLSVSNLRLKIKPAFFSRFSQPEHFFRFKPDHLLLNRARFTGYILCYYLTFLAGLNLQVQTWINMQVSPDNPILQAQINSPIVIFLWSPGKALNQQDMTCRSVCYMLFTQYKKPLLDRHIS